MDLRSGQETERAPSALRETPGVDYYAVPMLDQVTSSAFQGKLPERMGEVYVELLTHMGEQFVRILELFAAHRGRACLFHCTAGYADAAHDFPAYHIGEPAAKQHDFPGSGSVNAVERAVRPGRLAQLMGRHLEGVGGIGLSG